MSTGGDSALGGDDFDQRIFCWTFETAKLKPLSIEDSRLLLTRAREAKEYLTPQLRRRSRRVLTAAKWSILN